MKPVAVLLVHSNKLTARRIRPTHREVFTAFLGMTCVNWRIFRLRLGTVAVNP